MQLSEFAHRGGNVLSLEIRSEVGDARFKAICNDMDQSMASLGKLRLVLIMHPYPSLNTAENFYDDLRFLRLYDHAINKVAVVSDQRGYDTWAGLFSLFSGIRIDFFKTTQTEALSEWILSG